MRLYKNQIQPYSTVRCFKMLISNTDFYVVEWIWVSSAPQHLEMWQARWWPRFLPLALTSRQSSTRTCLSPFGMSEVEKGIHGSMETPLYLKRVKENSRNILNMWGRHVLKYLKIIKRYVFSSKPVFSSNIVAWFSIECPPEYQHIPLQFAFWRWFSKLFPGGICFLVPWAGYFHLSQARTRSVLCGATIIREPMGALVEQMQITRLKEASCHGWFSETDTFGSCKNAFDPKKPMEKLRISRPKQLVHPPYL